MSTPHLIQTIFEICLISFTVWAMFNEDRFVAFEEKIIAKWKARKSK